MKVILNEDVYNLGEEGDVKTVKSGYARNFLIPRGLAVPFTKGNAKIFEARKDIIEKKKEEKRKAAMGQKEKIEALEISIPMPAGENGRLFGSVNNAMISDYLAKNGIQMERKKIELTEHNIKTVGKFTAKIKLYDNEAAQLTFTIVNEKGESAVAATKDEKKEVAAEKETPVEETVDETAVTEEVVDETAEETVEEIPVVEETVEEIAPVDDDEEPEEESATEEKA